MKKRKVISSFESVMIIGDPENDNKGLHKGLWGTVILEKDTHLLVRLDVNPYKVVKIKKNCVKYK